MGLLFGNGKEQWKPTIEAEGNYAVSNMGRVKRIKGTPNGGAVIGRILKPSKNSHNQMQITLMANGEVFRYMVHQLVASAFIGPCPVGMEINHKDLDRTNNCDWNLEYVTGSNNVKHAIKNGAFGSAKLDWIKVRKARHFWSTGNYTIAEIGKLFGVASNTMSYVLNGRTWVE